ncbi:nuclear transport factor 2 family protein [Catenuloplanes sp. NPDC051500]|uniref:nuclear transport factor 2 family protein n=1 Tax=Catenuloplanes sp. NPDC051500 TaxID=3363959 RepID=UPI003787AD42
MEVIMPHAKSREPRDVIEFLLESLAGKDLVAVADLYAEDAFVRQPFAKPEIVLTGRSQIEQFLGGLRQAPITLSPRDIQVHQTADPEVVVGEWENDMTRTTDGATASMHNIAVFCVRDGRVVWSRDYHDHAVIAGLLS